MLGLGSFMDLSIRARMDGRRSSKSRFMATLPALSLATVFLRRGPHDFQPYRNPRMRCMIRQCIQVEFINASTEQIIQAGLGKTKTSGRNRLRRMPALNCLLNGNHQVSGRLHFSRFSRGWLDGIPDAVKISGFHLAILLANALLPATLPNISTPIAVQNFSTHGRSSISHVQALRGWPRTCR